MHGQRSVLIVDRSEETREVLRTALERRGLRILTTGRVRRGLELACQNRPDLIVLDLDLGDSAPATFAGGFATPSCANRPHLLTLGSLRQNCPQSDGEFIAKPYHYAALVRRIEELLDTAVGPVARAA